MDKKKKCDKCTQKDAYPTQKITFPPSHEDPLGSYTGNPEGEDKMPVQDADDL